MTQPTALFLADILEDAGKPADIAQKCASELRRLHAANMDCLAWYEAAKSERDALLEALKLMRDKYGEYACRVCDLADAAITKAEGEKT